MSTRVLLQKEKLVMILKGLGAKTNQLGKGPVVK
jgi:hypothetical protein